VGWAFLKNPGFLTLARVWDDLWSSDVFSGLVGFDLVANHRTVEQAGIAETDGKRVDV